MTYRLQLGMKHEEDNSVSAENAFGEIDYGPTFEDALHSLMNHARSTGNDWTRIEGGLFKHIPGVEAIYLERLPGIDEQERIWLIRRLTSFS